MVATTADHTGNAPEIKVEIAEQSEMKDLLNQLKPSFVFP